MIPTKKNRGNKIIINPIAANPSFSYIPYKIEIIQDKKGAIASIVVIPQTINLRFFDLPLVNARAMNIPIPIMPKATANAISGPPFL